MSKKPSDTAKKNNHPVIEMPVPEDISENPSEKPANLDTHAPTTATYNITQYYYSYGDGPQIGTNNGTVTHLPADNKSEDNLQIVSSASIHPSELPQSVKWADIMWEIDEKDYSIKSPSFIDDYRIYIKKVEQEFSTIKTLLFGDSPQPFHECYVCNDISYDAAKTRQAARVLEYEQYLRKESKKSSFKLKGVKPHLHNATVKKIGLLSRYVILTGSGGIGKSMMLRHLLIDSVSNINSGGFIPVFTSLRDFNESYSTLEDYIFSENKSLLTVELNTFRNNLASGGFLILLDGLDEIPYHLITHFDKLLESFTVGNPGNQMIISSRPYTNFVSYSKFTVLQLLPFTRKQSISLIEKLKYREDNPEIKRQFLTYLSSNKLDRHDDFLKNPLLLTIMLMTFDHFRRIADKMHIFFNDAYQTLYWKHDKENNHGFERPFKTGFDCDTFAQYLAEFCAKSYFSNKIDFTWNEMDNTYQHLSFNRKAVEPHASTKDFVEDVCNNLCLMYSVNGIYSFYHRTFQEYFCALYFTMDKTDAQLARFGELYIQSASENKSSDQTFGMLYDMMPIRIESAILLPFLDKLFGKDPRTSYYSYLISNYPVLLFDYGETPSLLDYPSNPPYLLYFRFLANRYGFLHSDEDLGEYALKKELPFKEEYTTNRYIRLFKKDENGIDDYEMVSFNKLGEDWLENYKEEHGDYPVPDGASIEYPLREIELEHYNGADGLSDFDSFLCDPDFPLLIEYQAAKKCYKEMKERVSRARRTDGLFD